MEIIQEEVMKSTIPIKNHQCTILNMTKTKDSFLEKKLDRESENERKRVIKK